MIRLRYLAGGLVVVWFAFQFMSVVNSANQNPPTMREVCQQYVCSTP